jgi:hypothetical protein
MALASATNDGRAMDSRSDTFVRYPGSSRLLMRHPSFRFTLVVLCLSALGPPGCGWRTGLDDYTDGSLPDGGRRDAGRIDGSIPDVPRRDTGGSCTTSSDCDDGLACNGPEFCSDGRCVGGGPVSCFDGVDCTRDSCVEPVGCVFTPDDFTCGPGFRCDPFVGCVPVGGGCRGDFDCDDGDVCNGSERCGMDGVCVGGGPIACPIDSIACTVESCDPLIGCTSFADSSLCPRGEICRAGLGCMRVACMSSFDCDDGDPCNGTETCDTSRNVCRRGTPLSCDDGVPCTLDRCIPGSGCFSSTSSEICFDGIDNDCNGLADCEDFVCMGRPECGGCMPISFAEFRCSDFVDDDCDGLPDCADPDCFGSPECGACTPIADSEIFCSDFRDDDCDFQLDCGDPDCFGTPDCGACSDREFVCFDGRDDDCDGAIDCIDPDCSFDPGCGCAPISMREINCTDGRDDDCDGLFDCTDFDCSGRPGCGCIPRSMTELFCRDGIDDDCDGALDCRDMDCATRPFCGGMCTPTGANELGVTACTNARDDDCDGRLDCADPDCSPFGPMAECCNGRDDNGDGAIDEFTCYCEGSDDCVGVGTYEQVCWLNTFSICAPDCRRYGSDSFCTMYLPDLPRCNRTTGECEAR